MPLFYTFRRCPYAIRARLALAVSGVAVEHRQVLLKDKPQTMLQVSPKGTVPVLVLDDGQVIDESLDIMLWALEQYDPENWLKSGKNSETETILELINENDFKFKPWLDKYKYFERFPEEPQEAYRQQGLGFIIKLETLLSKNEFLTGNEISLADIAIAPFIRQFAHVDKGWFFGSEYPKVIAWLNVFLGSAIFQSVMIKN